MKSGPWLLQQQLNNRAILFFEIVISIGNWKLFVYFKIEFDLKGKKVSFQFNCTDYSLFF